MLRYINNRLTRQINHQSDFINLSTHPDLTLDTLKEFKDEDWDWTNMMFHKNFNLKWLRVFPNKPWDWYNMHTSIKFRIFWISLFPNADWNEREISRRATIRDLKRFPQFNWDWEEVTCCSNISVQQMVNNPTLPWQFGNLGFTRILHQEIAFIRFFIDRFTPANWIDFTLTTPWIIIKTNIDLPWDYHWVRFESYEIIESDLEIFSQNIQRWNWEYLSMNVPVDFIIKYPHLPWVHDMVSQNKTLRFKHLREPFQWDYSLVPCEPIFDIVLKWHSANVIKRAWRDAIANPEYKMCRERIYREASELKNILDL